MASRRSTACFSACSGPGSGPYEANKYLDKLGELFESDALEVVIDHTCALEAVPEALERFGSGMAHGKVVVEVRR